MSNRDSGEKTSGGTILRASLAASGMLAGGLLAYSRFFVPHFIPLPHALTGKRRTFSGRAGRLSYYVGGEGAPLLLIHSVNASASAYEVLPIYEHFRPRRRVYAVDLPGFGFSD